MVISIDRIGRTIVLHCRKRDGLIHLGGLVSLFLVACTLAEVHAQSDVPLVTQIPRQSLQNLVKVNDQDECVTLGNALMGRTNGLEGIVCREGDFGTGNDFGGYVRWHVVFRRIDGLPFPRDEQLRMSFLATYTGYEPEVIHGIELRQGDFESRSSFLAPSYSRGSPGYHWRQVFCRVYSDGRELRGLRGMHNGGYNYNGQQNADPQAKFRSIVIGSRDSINELATLTTEERQKFGTLESKNRWLLSQSHLALLKNLPTDWREIAAKPSYAIDADELKLLVPEQSLTLQQFVVAGGQLIIADCQTVLDTSGELRKDVDEWLKKFVPSTAKNPESWDIKKDVNTNRKEKSLPIGFGKIVVYQDDVDQFTKPQAALSIFNTVPRLDRLFDTEMMNWMIPKLGQPPVLMFCLSIGAFAVMAGPGLLWWTNVKTRRPIWLLVFFPLFALLITSSIFAYALVHDGFGTSGRIRSITWVDAESGFGCAYSRQTYFSGFPPSITAFKNVSEVWEVQSPHEDRRRTYTSEPESDVSLRTADGQQIYRGLLTAREQKQWMVTTPVAGLKPFEWARPSDDKAPRVRNLLREAWQLAIFVDRDKNLYSVPRLAAESESELQPIAIEDARKRLIDATPKPLYPVGYFGNGSQSLFDWFSNNSNYRSASLGNGVNLPESIEAVIESWPKGELAKPNRFMILLERADHLDRPYQANVTETDSSHLMMGTW